MNIMNEIQWEDVASGVVLLFPQLIERTQFISFTFKYQKLQGENYG